MFRLRPVYQEELEFIAIPSCSIMEEVSLIVIVSDLDWSTKVIMSSRAPCLQVIPLSLREGACAMIMGASEEDLVAAPEGVLEDLIAVPEGVLLETLSFLRQTSSIVTPLDSRIVVDQLVSNRDLYSNSLEDLAQPILLNKSLVN